LFARIDDIFGWVMGSVNRNAMQKAQRKQCWTLLLLGSLIVSFALMFSYWYIVPRQLQFWTLFGYNGTDNNGKTSELKFYMPPEPVPKELNLKRGGPFIYQILH